MEKDINLKNQEKLAKVFKAVISAGLVAPVFVSVSACKKTEIVVEEEALTVAQEIIPETTTSVETTAQETSPLNTEVVETGPIEYEGVTINPIEGLRFDNGNFFAIDGNPYGLKAEAKAGVFIKDAFELNGQIVNSIGLKPEVIESLQSNYLKKNGELKFPVPFDLREDKEVVMELLENKYANENEVLKDYRWEDFTFLGVKVSKETVIYSPLKTVMVDGNKASGCLVSDYIQGNNGAFAFNLRKLSDQNEEIFAGNPQEKIDWLEYNIFVQGAELIIFNDKLTTGGQIETKIGEPLARVIEDPDPELDFYFQWGNPEKKDFSINMLYHLNQVREVDGQYRSISVLETGNNIFLEIGNIKISILPVQ